MGARCKLRRRRVLLTLVLVVTSASLMAWHLQTPDSPVTSRADYLQVYPQREWSERKEGEEMLLLLWTNYFGEETWFHTEDSLALSGCPGCRLTRDRSRLRHSHAVLFHCWDLWNYFLGRSLPAFRSPHQVWVITCQEPPPHNTLPLSRYNSVFNWTASYRRDADVHLPYGHVVPLTEAERREQRRHLAGRDWSAGKTKMAAWVASNCYDSARRRLVVRELSRHIAVDTFGECGNRKLPCGRWASCPDVLRDYKFYLAFENSLCADYVTEKFWNALRRNQVPVTLGGINYTGVVPPGSYINLDDFGSVAELAAYLRYLDNNATAYNGYFRWREEWREESRTEFCRICKALLDRGRPAQVYTDLATWESVAESPTCELFSIAKYVSQIKDGLMISLGIK